MTRIGPHTVVQAVGTQLVIVNEATGQEVTLPGGDGGRLAAALPYVLTGSVGVAEVAAERVRQLRHWSRYHDLTGGPEHAANMLRVASFYSALAARQVVALESLQDTRELHDLIMAGTLAEPEGWPTAWRWDPSIDPMRNATMAAALCAAAIDALDTIRQVSAEQSNGG